MYHTKNDNNTNAKQDTGRRGVNLDSTFGPFLPVQIDLVGVKLQMFNLRDLMTRNAILFHLGNDPFTPGGLGVFFGKRSFPNEARGAVVRVTRVTQQNVGCLSRSIRLSHGKNGTTSCSNR